MTKIKPHKEIDAAAKMITDWRSMAIVHAIYENGPIRFTDLEVMLTLSPTIISGKLSQLTAVGIIRRHQANGAKEVLYETQPIAEKMVEAYHLLESVNDQLQ